MSLTGAAGPSDHRASLLLPAPGQPFDSSGYRLFTETPLYCYAPPVPLRPKLVIDDESFDLDEMTIPDPPPAPLSSPVEGSSRKSSNSASHNSSFRRKLSGCFRKQDSNECPMLSSTPTSLDQVEDDDQRQAQAAKKRSWYRKATSKISRHRSVSEERPPSRPAYEQQQLQLLHHQSHNAHNEHQLQQLDPRSVSSNSIYDGHRRNRASSFLSASTSPYPAAIVASDSNLTDINRHTLATAAAAAPHRASFHGNPSRLQQPATEVVGSAESLVGHILVEQGLGKYVDPVVLRATQRELAETLNMTEEGEQARTWLISLRHTCWWVHLFL